MKLTVYKNNEHVFEIDLFDEIQSLDGDFFSTYIGRSSECQITLDDRKISREHALLTFKNKKWFIKKIATFSPLLLNGKGIDEEELNNNDVINIAEYSINVQIQELIKVSIDNPDEAESEVENEALISNDSSTEVLAENESDNENDETIASDKIDSSSESLEELSAFGDDNFDNEYDSNNSEDSEEKSNEYDDGFENDSESSSDYPVDNFDDDGFDSDEKTQVFQTFANVQLEIFGEYSPYDKYKLEDGETFIGRDPKKCQIVLNDPQVSGSHSVIKKSKMNCIIEDLNSGNGTILNGSRTNKKELCNGDEFIIGDTTFTVVISSNLIQDEQSRLMPVQENQVIEVEEIVEVNEDFADGDELFAEGDGNEFGEVVEQKPKSLFSKESLKDPAQRKKLLYGAVGLMLLWVMLSDEPDPGKKVAQKNAGQSKGHLLTDKNKDKKRSVASTSRRAKKNLTKEDIEFIETRYNLSKELFERGRYSEAIFELEKIFPLDPEYKNSRQIYELSKQGVAKLEEEERKRKEEEERKVRQRKIKTLLKKAEESVENRKVKMAESYFSSILEIDPENFEVPQLKNELDSWVKEQEKIAVEKAQKEAERKRQVDLLRPGKNYYLKKRWFGAINKLEEFLKIEGIDEDLVKEATKMLTESQESLKAVVGPLIGKAKSLKEGQDLKGAYETYFKVLEYDPTSSDAITDMEEIRKLLYNRSRKIYREAIIAESLSLFQDAKEKFQEVQQISPSDSEYYKKATEKLREYID